MNAMRCYGRRESGLAGMETPPYPYRHQPAEDSAGMTGNVHSHFHKLDIGAASLVEVNA